MATKFLRNVVSQDGKVAVVTGANTGLGLEVAVALAAKGATVVMACRSPDKAQKAREEVLLRAGGQGAQSRVHVVQLDVSDFDSVREFRARLEAALGVAKSADLVVDRLVLNAGIMMPPSRELSKQGQELQLATNVLGHFLLTASLMDALKRSPEARVVSVSSVAHKSARKGFNFDDPKYDRKYDAFNAYAISKLGNLLFTFKLQRMLDEAGVQNVTAECAHPGVSNTHLFEKNSLWFLGFLGNSPAVGATPIVLAATDPRAPKAGYAGPWFADYFGVGVWGRPTIPVARDKAQQDRFWAWCEEVTGEKIVVN